MSSARSIRIGVGALVAIVSLVALSVRQEAKRQQTERARRSIEQARTDSIGASAARAEKASADSLLRVLTPQEMRSLPHERLSFILRHGTRDSAPATFDAVRRERGQRVNKLKAEQARASVEARAASIANAAVVASRNLATVDGSRCTRGTIDRAKQLAVRYPVWDAEAIGVVMCRMIVLGMTAEQLRASWGAPSKINRTVVTRGTHEQWIYGSTYVYVENGLVSSWQDSR